MGINQTKSTNNSVPPSTGNSTAAPKQGYVQVPKENRQVPSNAQPISTKTNSSTMTQVVLKGQNITAEGSQQLNQKASSSVTEGSVNSQGNFTPLSNEGNLLADIPPEIEKHEGRGCNRFMIFCCSFIAFLGIILLVLILLSLFAGIDIPIISNITGSIERVISSPEKEAERAEQAFLSTAVSLFDNSSSDKGGTLLSRFMVSSVSDSDLENVLDNYREVESVRYNIQLNFSNKFVPEGDTNFSYYNTSFSGIGAIENKNNDSKMETRMLFEYELNGDKIALECEYRTVGGTSYVRIIDLPENYSVIFGDVISYENKWIQVSPTEFDTAANLYIEESGDESGIIDEEKLKLIMDVLSDRRFIRNVRFIEDREVEGNKCKCIELSWEGEEVADLSNHLKENLSGNIDIQSVVDMLDKADYAILEACMGRRSKMLHQLKVELRGDSNRGEINYDITTNLWGYNDDMDIIAPKGSVNFDEVFNRLEDSSKSNQDNEVKDELKKIQIKIEEYYIEKNKFPNSLSDIKLDKKVFYGQAVQYKKNQNGYKLWITLPSGELYELIG